jgi:hypothetical protein
MEQFVDYIFCQQTSIISDRDSTIIVDQGVTPRRVEVPGWLAKPNEYPFVVFRREPSPVPCMGFLIRVDLALFRSRCGESLPFYLNFGSINAYSDYSQTRHITSSLQIYIISTVAVTISFERITVERDVKPIVINNAEWYSRHNVKSGIEVSYFPVFVDECPGTPTPNPSTWELVGGYATQEPCSPPFELFPELYTCPGTKSYFCGLRSNRLNVPCLEGPGGLVYFDELTQQHALVGLYVHQAFVACDTSNFRTYPKLFGSVSLIANFTLYDRFWNNDIM